MGKRSRKRTGPRGPGALVEPAPAYVPPPDRRSRKLEAPKAPWSPFPLVELTVLVGVVLILVGLFRGGDRAGPLLVVGFALVSVAALELAIREHFAGYRSHSTLLGGAAAIVLVVSVFFLTRVAYEVLLILGVVFFAASFQALRTIFARKTQGLGFRA